MDILTTPSTHQPFWDVFCWCVVSIVLFLVLQLALHNNPLPWLDGGLRGFVLFLFSLVQRQGWGIALYLLANGLSLRCILSPWEGFSIAVVVSGSLFQQWGLHFFSFFLFSAKMPLIGYMAFCILQLTEFICQTFI